MKSFMANPDTIKRKWYLVDANGCTLGRLSSQVASVLRGKNKPEFTPHERHAEAQQKLQAYRAGHICECAAKGRKELTAPEHRAVVRKAVPPDVCEVQHIVAKKAHNNDHCHGNENGDCQQGNSRHQQQNHAP